MDAASASALTVGLVAGPGGAARFGVTLAGQAAGTSTVVVDSRPVLPGGWYELLAGVDAADQELELDVATYYPPAASDQPDWVGDSSATVTSWTTPFVPAVPTGGLRIASAKPATAAPATPVTGWIGDVDEVLAFRGVMPSTDLGTPSTDLNRWIGDPPAGSIGRCAS